MQKALRMVDESVLGFDPDTNPKWNMAFGNDSKDVNHACEQKKAEGELREPTDKRMFVLAAAMKEGYSVEELHALTDIDPWFLNKLRKIIQWHLLHKKKGLHKTIDSSVLLEAKKLGFSDKQLGKLMECSEMVIRDLREKYDIHPWVKQIDTVAAEWPAATNYLYLTYR